MPEKVVQKFSLSDAEIKNYCRWTNLFRSWFWRFYDHLFRLCLVNLGWFISCFGIYWISSHLEIFGNFQQSNFLGIYFFYLTECIFSLGWGFLVFKLMIEGNFFWGDFWFGMKNYFWKAIGLSALSGFFIGLASYNLYFYLHLQSYHRFLGLLLAGFIFWLSLFCVSAALLQWPILFFQNPPFSKIILRSFMLVVGDGFGSLATLAFFAFILLFFTLVPFLWFFLGPVFFFSFQCISLEKQFLRYKITFKEKPLDVFLVELDHERQRGWRDLLRPWEN